jgi:hypothetical protein
MDMHVRIYKPSKTALQSGQAKTKEWVLEFEPEEAETPDPLMGWSGSRDTRRQLLLHFHTMDDAIAYARKNGHTYTLLKPHERRVRPKSYASNFAYNRLEPWTH